MTGTIHEGGCLCGALRYRVTGQGLSLTACHCTECQRTSGSGFGLSWIVLRDAVQLVKGTPRIFEKVYQDGRHKRQHFCGECGGRIWNELPRIPQIFNIKPGTLDDAKWLDPVAHIWLSEKQPWTVVPEHALCFDKQPEDFSAVLKAYAEQQASRAQ
jgi:hypothetical protein